MPVFDICHQKGPERVATLTILFFLTPMKLYKKRDFCHISPLNDYCSLAGKMLELATVKFNMEFVSVMQTLV